jgi:uncharacterized membrane protein (UPF0136 family)
VIAVSALLVVVAATLLARGVTAGSIEYLYSSVVASAVSALALIVAVRRPVPFDDDFDAPVRG